MNSNLKYYAGQTAYFAVENIKASYYKGDSAQISGSFPIIGALNTINSSLKTGQISTSEVSNYDLRFQETSNISSAPEDIVFKKLLFKGKTIDSFSNSVITVLETGKSYDCFASTHGEILSVIFLNLQMAIL